MGVSATHVSVPTLIPLTLVSGGGPTLSNVSQPSIGPSVSGIQVHIRGSSQVVGSIPMSFGSSHLTSLTYDQYQKNLQRLNQQHYISYGYQ